MTYKLKTPTIYDFSSWEDRIKWDEMINPKPLAVIMRASIQGAGTRYRSEDTTAVAYVNECKQRGIKYGLYHFLSPNGIAEQAALFLSVWKKCGGADLAPIVDVEIDLNVSYPAKPYGSTIGNAVWQNHVKVYLDLVAAGTGRTPIIYTNRNFWSFVMTKQGLLQQLAPPVWTKDYPLWLAWYPTRADDFAAPPKSELPAGWDTWAMWQWAQFGRTEGYLANDLNIASDWYAEELGGIVTPPLPDPDPEPFEWPEKLVAHHGTETKDYLPDA